METETVSVSLLPADVLTTQKKPDGVEGLAVMTWEHDCSWEQSWFGFCFSPFPFHFRSAIDARWPFCLFNM